MPYKNIIFVKLFWKDLLHGDDRFIERLDDDQKGLYLMLILLAGATNNNIRNDENYLKRVLNLRNNSENIRKNLLRISEVFPKFVLRGDYYKFKNFNKLHNYVRNADGTPKESPRVAKTRIDLIRREYIKIKGFALEDFTPDDYARTAKAIKTLILKANNDELVIQGLKWAARQTWCDWTLETVIKKWPDIMKSTHMKPYVDATLKQIEGWKKEERFEGSPRT